MRETTRMALAVAAATGLLGTGLGCAGALRARAGAYRYFETPAPDDAWSAKIRNWQLRERAARAEPVFDTPAPVAGTERARAAAARSEAGDLRKKLEAFRRERKRALAREVADWVQGEARRHYVADGPIDHWATYEETLRRNGDDCDGLELLAYHLLRDLGFDEDEIFRAIVVRPSDDQHHMVTLWFETPGDPWVIDPTGAMTRGMPRMSENPEWVPLKVFTETGEWSAVQAARARR